jgi:hypothetical protein
MYTHTRAYARAHTHIHTHTHTIDLNISLYLCLCIRSGRCYLHANTCRCECIILQISSSYRKASIIVGNIRSISQRNCSTKAVSVFTEAKNVNAEWSSSNMKTYGRDPRDKLYVYLYEARIRDVLLYEIASYSYTSVTIDARPPFTIHWNAISCQFRECHTSSISRWLGRVRRTLLLDARNFSDLIEIHSAYIRSTCSRKRDRCTASPRWSQTITTLQNTVIIDCITVRTTLFTCHCLHFAIFVINYLSFANDRFVH